MTKRTVLCVTMLVSLASAAVRADGAPKYRKLRAKEPATLTCTTADKVDHVMRYRAADQMPQLAAYDGTAQVQVTLYQVKQLQLSGTPDGRGQLAAAITVAASGEDQIANYRLVVVSGGKPVQLTGHGLAGDVTIALQDCRTLKVTLLEEKNEP